MNASLRKKESVHNFTESLLKKRKYHEVERASTAGETVSPNASHIQSIHDLSLEQSVLAEAASNGSVLALCGRESTPEDLFESFKRLLHFTKDEGQPFSREVRKIVYPLYVNSVINLLTRAGPAKAGAFCLAFSPGLPPEHQAEAGQLGRAVASRSLLPQGLVQRYHAAQPTVPMSNAAFKHLLSFMELEDNTALYVLLQKSLHLEVYGTSTAVSSGIALMEPKKASQKKKEVAKPSEALTRAGEVHKEGSGGKEGRSVAPESKHLNPLQEFKENLGQAAKACLSLPSITTYQSTAGMNCCCLGYNSKQLIGGFENSSIHVWCLCECSGQNGCLRTEHSFEWEEFSGNEVLNTGFSSSNPSKSSHVVLHGHSGPVYSVHTTQNGGHLLSASEDTSVRLWDLTRSNCVAVYKGHSYPVFDVSLSPLGVHFATASYDRTARLWSCDSTYPIRMFAGHNASVDVVRFHGNCNYLATGSSDHTCRLWDIQSGQCVRLFSSCKSPVTAVMFSEDGRSLFCGHGNGVIQQLDIGQGHLIAEHKGLTRRVLSIGQTPDGRLVCGGSIVGELAAWRSVDTPETSKQQHVQLLSPLWSIRLARCVLKDVFFTHKNRAVCVSTSEQPQPQ